MIRRPGAPIAVLASAILILAAGLPRSSPAFSAAAPESAAARADSSAPRPDTPASLPDTSKAADSVRVRVKEFPRPDLTLVARLRAGGYVIVFRHAITDWSQRDADGEHFEDRSVQRNLSKEGEAQAASIGKAIADLRIPIGSVLASPMWRCRDTAQIAFGRHQVSPELFRRGAEFRAMRLVMMSTEPEEGKNLVLVTHQDLLIPIVEGLRRDQLKEGDAFVVKPLGEGKFEIVAQVTPDDWAGLAAAAKAAGPAVKSKAPRAKGPKSQKAAKK